MITIASQPDVKRDKLDNSENPDLDPLQNTEQDLPEKDYSKRTFGSTYDSYSLAKHIKLKGGQKVVLGYTPVDLKYVPVIKPLRNGWRFKPRPAMRPRPVVHLPVRPKPDSNGWKPILHVPPPQQTNGWAKPAVTVLKPIRPSAPDHIHHDHVHEHDNHHVHNYHHHDDHHHDIVHDHHHQVVVPSVVPTVVPAVVPTVPVHDIHPHIHTHDIHGHFDYVHNQPHPQVVYFNPLTHVARPELPVLPLGATFPVPVASIAPQQQQVVAPVAVPTDYYHAHYPHYQFIQPQPQPHLDVVHEVPAPHFHPTQAVPVSVAPAPLPVVPTPNYYDYHHHGHHEHVPQVYEYPSEVPQSQLQPHPQPVNTITPQPQSVEYHGHLAHLIQTPYQNHQHIHNAHQYIPENYNPHILPGSTGTLSPGFLNPGYTDLQIPEHLPEHPNYNHLHPTPTSAVAPTEESYYHGHVGLLPEGIVQPQLALEPPINK